MRKLISVLISIAILLVAPKRSESFPAVAHFTGSVISVYDPDARLPASIAVGAEVTGGYSYELDGVSVSFPGPNYAEYIIVDGGLSMWVTIAGTYWSARNGSPASLQVSVANDNVVGFYDSFVVVAQTAVAFPFEVGYPGMIVGSHDMTAPYTLLPSLELPTTNQDIAWAEATLHRGAVYCDASPPQVTVYWRINYRVDSIEFVTTGVERHTWSGIKKLYR